MSTAGGPPPEALRRNFWLGASLAVAVQDWFKTRTKSAHPLQWVVEPIEEEPSFIAKAMFGCQGCYLFGRLVLVLAARGGPWMGLLIPTDKKHHPSLRREHPGLVSHAVLKKWLYLPESTDDFEERARTLVESILANDPRLGVEPASSSAKVRKSRGKPFPQRGITLRRGAAGSSLPSRRSKRRDR